MEGAESPMKGGNMRESLRHSAKKIGSFISKMFRKTNKSPATAKKRVSFAISPGDVQKYP